MDGKVPEGKQCFPGFIQQSLYGQIEIKEAWSAVSRHEIIPLKSARPCVGNERMRGCTVRRGGKIEMRPRNMKKEMVTVYVQLANAVGTNREKGRKKWMKDDQ